MPERRSRLAPFLTAVLVLSLCALHAAVYWHQINDDAFITFRYSRFLALGRGPYFNVGEHVEGYTNFLLMILMAGVIRLFGPDEVLFAAKLVGAASALVAAAAAAGLTGALLRHLEATARAARWLAWLSGALVAVNSGFALNSTTGLETTFFSAWVLLGLWALEVESATGRWRGSALFFALAALTRPEGLAVAAAVLLARYLRGDGERGEVVGGEQSLQDARRLRFRLDAVVVGLVVAGHFALRFVLYDGELLPNSYYAKAEGFSRVSAGQYLVNFARFHLVGVLAALPLLALLAPAWRGLREALPSWAVLLVAPMAVFKTGADWMPGFRLLVPYLPVWAALSTFGLAAVGERLAPERHPALAPRLTLLTGLLLLGLLWVWEAPTRDDYLQHVTTRAEGYMRGHAALADWLQEVSTPGQTVALMDIGLIGYLCIDLNVIDITGLTDRYIAKSPGSFLDKRFDPAYVFERRPDYIVIVLTGPTDLKDPKELQAWTDIENRIVATADFRQHYLRPRPASPATTRLEQLAAVLGAERVFEHSHPGSLYQLVVYTRKPA